MDIPHTPFSSILLKVSEDFQNRTYIHIRPPYNFPNVEDRHKYLFFYELSTEGNFNIPCEHVDQGAELSGNCLIIKKNQYLYLTITI
jgi:hypothetical protein